MSHSIYEARRRQVEAARHRAAGNPTQQPTPQSQHGHGAPNAAAIYERRRQDVAAARRRLKGE